MLDALGRSFDFPAPPRRVVSLVPSLTETLFEIGAAADVVGITEFCIFPAGLDRPRVGGTKNPDVETIRRLAPDLVHMNLEENLKRHATEVERFAPVFVTEPKSIGDVRGMIATLGTIHGCAARAGSFVDELDREVLNIPARRFTFVCPIWKQPWMWCGGDTYVSRLVEAAGGVNLLAAQARYPAVELPTVLASNPEVVFLPDEPYAFTKRDREEVESMSAARVVGPFPGHLFTWHGTRTILGLRFLHEALGADGR